MKLEFPQAASAISADHEERNLRGNWRCNVPKSTSSRMQRREEDLFLLLLLVQDSRIDSFGARSDGGVDSWRLEENVKCIFVCFFNRHDLINMETTKVVATGHR